MAIYPAFRASWTPTLGPKVSSCVMHVQDSKGLGSRVELLLRVILHGTFIDMKAVRAHVGDMDA